MTNIYFLALWLLIFSLSIIICLSKINNDRHTIKHFPIVFIRIMQIFKKGF